MDGTYGDDANDGSSWQAAVKTIERGLDLAGSTGWTVVVAPGMYTGAGNKNLDFRGKAVHLVSVGGAENCIIECEGSGRGFYFHCGETADSVLDGFTIQNGSPPDWLHGGGLVCRDSSPTITNCVIANNSAGNGGGIGCINANPKIENCTISGNTSACGGGFRLEMSSPVISRCLIRGNSAVVGEFPWGDGGGIHANSGSSPLFVNCLIEGNHGGEKGGAVSTVMGANVTFTNCVLSGNTAGVYGGGVSTYDSACVLNNSIVWGNDAGLEGRQIYAWEAPSFVTLNNCNYANEINDVAGPGVVTPTNCITTDPLFVDAAAGDYHLQGSSPCIDTGSNDLVPADVTTDLDGNPRISDGDLDGVETVDMGAYEYQLVTDITPPAITIVSPVEGETWYWSETRHSEFYADDDLSGIKSVEASVNGMPVESCQPITVSELAVGENILTVRAQDNAGNVSEEGVKFFVDVSFDGTVDIVDGFYFEGLITTWGTANSLVQHLQNAQIKELEGKFHIAIHQLDAFVAVLRAQRAISIKDEAYQLLFACQDELRMPLVKKPLEVVKELPECGAFDVSPFTKIWFKFSAPVNPETVDSDTFKVCVLTDIEPPVTAEVIAAAKEKARANPNSDTCIPVDGAYSFEQNNTVAVFTPTEPLPLAATIYRGVGEYVEDKSIEDTFGNPLEGIKDCHFYCVGPVVDIDADVNRDGYVKNEKEDGDFAPPEDDVEETIGIVVVCDKDKVYTDKKEPALRREIVVRATGGTGKARVARKATKNLKMYDKKKKGTEQFGDKIEIVLSPGSYWLQGGSKPSENARDEYLKVRTDKEGSEWSDQINVTVMWVEISTKTGGNLWPSPLFDKHDLVKNALGHDELGVQIYKGTPWKEKFANGCAMSIGWIEPYDLNEIIPKTLGYTDADHKKGIPAKAKYGFVWRRYVSYREYEDGFDKEEKNKLDDPSHEYGLDTDPDPVNCYLVITSFDAPCVIAKMPHFWNLRYNFREHVILHWYPDKPERCSEKHKWSVSIDTACRYNDHKVVFIRGKPNDGDLINEVKNNSHFDLDPHLKPPKLTAVDTKIIDQKEVYTEVTITGTNLLGKCVLAKAGETEWPGSPFLVKEMDTDNRYSDLTEAKVRFRTYGVDTPSPNWELVVKNAAGSDKIGGFKIINGE